MQRILATRPDAFPLVETYMFSRRIGLGALFSRVPATDAGAPPRYAPPGIGRLFDRDELVVETRAIALAWLRAGIGAEARFAIEKSPWHLHELGLIAEVLPEARFVNVLRDGRDVAVSLVHARRSWSDWGQREASPVVAEAARSWRDGLSLVARAAPVLGSSLLEVRFEDLKADPRAAVARLFDHCRMPHSDADAERAVELTDFARQPGPAGPGEIRRAGRVGEWRERFGIADGRRFERIAGGLLREQGYESDPRWWLRQPLRSRL